MTTAIAIIITLYIIFMIGFYIFTEIRIYRSGADNVYDWTKNLSNWLTSNKNKIPNSSK